jgi:hypothetical protein
MRAHPAPLHRVVPVNKVFRITLVVDEGWLGAIANMTSFVENDEICRWAKNEELSELGAKREINRAAG